MVQKGDTVSVEVIRVMADLRATAWAPEGQLMVIEQAGAGDDQAVIKVRITSVYQEVVFATKIAQSRSETQTKKKSEASPYALDEEEGDEEEDEEATDEEEEDG